MRTGIVSFVGGGPGDADLRTARAAQRLAEADVVIELDVSAGSLIALAREGKRVVCLIPGDPLESPAVVAQVRAVAAAGVLFDVVPGIGARGAAGAFAGVLGRAVRVAAADVPEALADEPPATVVTLIAAAGTASQRVVVTTASDGPSRVA